MGSFYSSFAKKRTTLIDKSTNTESIIIDEPIEPLAEVESLKKELDELKSVVKTLLGDISNEECIICQKLLYSEDQVVTSCNHKFHQGCLSMWILNCVKYKKETKCPICRNKLYDRNGNLVDDTLFNTHMVNGSDLGEIINLPSQSIVSIPLPTELTLDTPLQPIVTSVADRRALFNTQYMSELEMLIEPEVANGDVYVERSGNGNNILSNYYHNELGLTAARVRPQNTSLIERILNL